MFGRKKLAILVAEFLGAAVLTLVVLAVSRSPVGVSWFVAATVGLAYALLVMTVGAFSGAHANPAVTVGLFSLRKIGPVQAVVYVASQMLGGLAAWALYSYLADTTLTSTAGNSYDWRVVAAEGVGAFVFTFGLAAAVYQKYEGARLAFTAGAALALGVIVASVGANGLLNPAVALGTRSWGMAYALGPVLGAIVGMNLYTLFFAPEAFAFGVKPVRKTTKRKR